MTPALTTIALAVVGGAVLAVAARDARVALVGLLAALALAPLIGPWPPDPAADGARVAGAILAVYMLRLAFAGRGVTEGSRLGWPAETLAAAAAFVAGAAAHEAATPALGTVEATAAGIAVLALAIGPLIEREDRLRQGIGLALALTGGELLRVGLAGTASALESVAVAAAVATAGAAVAASFVETEAVADPSAPRPRRLQVRRLARAFGARALAQGGAAIGGAGSPDPDELLAPAGDT
ncbi:MAG TPA: hypothetical protein VEY67_11175 [Candidatus Dormibacteraeota bacterium]|nr:hypothetical protein [Candidatus Dormibacteraeota bacterium]